MSIQILALLVGIVAGLRAMTAPAVLSCAVRWGGLSLQGTPLAFMGYTFTPWILVLAAVGELVNDKLPKTPSRMVPMQFVTRLITGAWAGAALTGTQGNLWSGALVGAIGAAIGTWSGYRARHELATLMGKDLPAALSEDVIAITGAILIVLAVG